MESSDLPLIKLKLLTTYSKLKTFIDLVEYMEYTIPKDQEISEEELSYFSYNFYKLKRLIDKALEDIDMEYIQDFESQRLMEMAESELKKHKAEHGENEIK